MVLTGTQTLSMCDMKARMINCNIFLCSDKCFVTVWVNDISFLMLALGRFFSWLSGLMSLVGIAIFSLITWHSEYLFIGNWYKKNSLVWVNSLTTFCMLLWISNVADARGCDPSQRSKSGLLRHLQAFNMCNQWNSPPPQTFEHAVSWSNPKSHWSQICRTSTLIMQYSVAIVTALVDVFQHNQRTWESQCRRNTMCFCPSGICGSALISLFA